MIRTRIFRMGLVLLAVFAAVNFIAPMPPRAQAQDSVTEITGLVEAISLDNTFVVNGVTIDWGTFDLTDIVNVGDWVTVTVTTTGEGEDEVFTLASLLVLESPDIDEDTILNDVDNCPIDANLDQADTDDDGIGDVCDPVDDTPVDDGEDEDTGEDTGDCAAREDHPVALAYAAEFDIEYDTVMGWHCDGFGFGEIGRALLLAEQSEDSEDALTAQDFLDMKADGMGWGQIMKDSGVSPSDLAPGRVISQKHHKHQDDTEDGGEDAVETEFTGHGNGNNGNNGHGNGNGNNGNGNGNGNTGTATVAVTATARNKVF